MFLEHASDFAYEAMADNFFFMCKIILTFLLFLFFFSFYAIILYWRKFLNLRNNSFF